MDTYNKILLAYNSGAEEFEGYPLLTQEAGTLTQQRAYREMHARKIEVLIRKGQSWGEYLDAQAQKYM